MISCLMVTRPTPRRIALARHSIDGYCRQTHAHRELVIVIDPSAAPADIAAFAALIEAMERPDIRVHIPAKSHRLGALRNISIEIAAGEVICQWDDDDLFHPQRLATQYVSLRTSDLEAVYLQEVMQYFPGRQALYLTNWRGTPAGAHPGTLLARRDALLHYPEHGVRSVLGEDLEIALELKRRRKVGYLGDAPHLHVYVSHGDNSWDAAHHAMLARELSVSVALLKRREASIRAGLASFAFPNDSIDMTGSNGVAFRL